MRPSRTSTGPCRKSEPLSRKPHAPQCVGLAWVWSTHLFLNGVRHAVRTSTDGGGARRPVEFGPVVLLLPRQRRAAACVALAARGRADRRRARRSGRVGAGLPARREFRGPPPAPP